MTTPGGDATIYETRVEDLPPALRDRVRVVADAAALNALLAGEFADALARRQARGEVLTAICPVGPLDYRVFARELLARGLDGRHLRTINMDEYLGEDGRLLPPTHPLSFRRFMEETFFSRLPAAARPRPENIVFPDPAGPAAVSDLIDAIGGADLCWAGFGITGHVAFNDPPAMTGGDADLAAFRRCRTRVVEIGPMSLAQMAIGGTDGNLEIIPRRAVTLGMHEILASKRFHLTFMRRWHAGLWRRGLLGPVTSAFPGSLLQEHPNLTITMTRLAAEPPGVNTAQATGEERA